MTGLEGSSCSGAAAHCITCGDEGVPMRVTAIGEDSALCADADGGVHQVAVDLIDGAAVGMTVLVHAGVAIGAAP